MEKHSSRPERFGELGAEGNVLCLCLGVSCPAGRGALPVGRFSWPWGLKGRAKDLAGTRSHGTTVHAGEASGADYFGEAAV